MDRGTRSATPSPTRIRGITVDTSVTLHSTLATTSLWAAETDTQMESHMTLVALPLAAAVALDASVAQMGVLTTSGTLPFLPFGCFAGG